MDKKIRDKAFSLFAQDVPKERIAKSLNISKNSIYEWIKKYDWQKRKNKIIKRQEQKTDETLSDIKVRQQKLIRGILGKYIEKLNKDKVVVSTGDVERFLRLELHLAGESEESVDNKVTVVFKDPYKNGRSDSKV